MRIAIIAAVVPLTLTACTTSTRYAEYAPGSVPVATPTVISPSCR